MKDLKIHVERAVRPVRASNLRKDRMREELLAHLTQIYQEEVARLANEPEAIAQARRRFGEPAEVTRELQASVPRWEQILYFRLLPDPPFLLLFPPKTAAESVVRWAARWSWPLLVFNSVAILLYLLLTSLVRGQPLPPNVIRFGLAVIVTFSVNLVCFPLFLEVIRRALYPIGGEAASWVRAASDAFLSSLLIVASSFGCLYVLGDGQFSWVEILTVSSSLLVLACLAPLGYLTVAWLWARDVNRYEEWGQLELQE
jgi:ATP-dependent Clp protease ATP-binding subunit ClpC